MNLIGRQEGVGATAPSAVPKNAEAGPWLEGPLQLVSGVTSLVGANDENLLFNPANGRYVRISQNALPIVERLESATNLSDLVADLATSFHYDEARLRPRVISFLGELRSAGVLTVPAKSASVGDRVVRSVRHTPIRRFPLTRSADRLFDLPARLLWAMGSHLRTATILAVAILVLAGVTSALSTLVGGSGIPVGAVVWPWPLGMVLVGLVLHESAHGVACRYYGVHVREAGIGLWYYFIPIAYVDRTDAYRVRGRFGRAVIALAGPATDLVCAAACFLVARSVGGPVQATASFTGVLFLLVMATNLNPLLPGDGHQAAEAVAGELNFRGRAMEYLLLRMTRRPLPSYHRAITRRRRMAYLGFGAVSFLYLVLLLAGFAVGAARLVSHLWR